MSIGSRTRRMMATLLMLSLALALPAMAADIPSEVTLFKNVNIFDGESEQLLEGYDVLVVRNLIKKVAEDIPIETVETKFGLKPSIPEQWCDANANRFLCPLAKFEHCGVLFHDKLVHRGPANNTPHVRISGEMTILLKL